MKNIAFLFVFSLMSSITFGQNIIEEKFSTYKSQDNFTSVFVSSKMFQLAQYIEVDESDDDLNDFKEMISSIHSLNMIVGEDVNNALGEYQLGVQKVNGSHEELMSVDSKDGNFAFFIDESGGVVHELVMIGAEKAKFIVLSLVGEMDLRQLSKLSHKMQGEGFQDLSKIFDHGAEQVKVYPNPATSSTSVKIEVPEEMVGATATVVDFSGKVIHRFPVSSTVNEINTESYAQGRYVIELQKEKVRMKKKLIIQ